MHPIGFLWKLLFGYALFSVLIRASSSPPGAPDTQQSPPTLTE